MSASPKLDSQQSDATVIYSNHRRKAVGEVPTPRSGQSSLSIFDRGCVKTQNWVDSRGALTIPDAKQIESRAIYEVVFNWYAHDLAFSHNLDPLLSCAF